MWKSRESGLKIATLFGRVIDSFSPPANVGIGLLSTKNRHRSEGSSMNHTKIFTPAAALTAFILGASPAHAQGHGYGGRVGLGVTRGPSRAMVGSRAAFGPRAVFAPQFVLAPGRAVARGIVGGVPFNSPHYFIGRPVRIGYGLSVGYPLALSNAYPYPYQYRYPAPYLASVPYFSRAPYFAPALYFARAPYFAAAPYFAPAHGYGIPAPFSLAIIGRIGVHVTRGAARLALRFLLP